MLMGKFKLARGDFQTVCKRIPHDKDAKRKLQECQRAIREAAFRDAIENENSKPASEVHADYNKIIVEESYEGPRIDDDAGVTVEFVTELLDWFRDQKKLHRKYVHRLVLDAIALMHKLPSLVDVSIPDGGEFTVCGDVHGQFYDVLNMFELNGKPSPTNPYLFNGDFVDRGSFSLEVILVFYAYKLLYPKHFFMSRGNHESISLNAIYGFDGEVKAKCDAVALNLFAESFCQLPLACCIGGKVLVMHGGLFAQDGVKLDDIRKIDRFRQPPEQGLMCEILWADPQAAVGRAPSKRGVGLQFGPDVTDRFCVDNGLDMVVRSHEVKDEGYEIMHDGKCVTVFSAPNCEWRSSFFFVMYVFAHIDFEMRSECVRICVCHVWLLVTPSCTIHSRRLNSRSHTVLLFGNDRLRPNG
jgi:serine/threonine-protein phosphatase 5